MGNGNSRLVKVGQKLEDAIKFDITNVSFDGDVSPELRKIQPELEDKTNYSFFYQVESITEPYSGCVVETSFPMEGAHPGTIASYHPTIRTITRVTLKPVSELKKLPNIDWGKLKEN